jgi:hypothetical protein
LQWNWQLVGFCNLHVPKSETGMIHEIVDPEPHSKPKFGDGWEYIPRWLRVVLYAIAIAAMVLAVYWTR